VLTKKWSEYNLTGIPKVNVAVHLESSGIIEIKSPTATCEESHLVNETRKIPKVKNTTDANVSVDANTTSEPVVNTTNKTNKSRSNKSQEEEFDTEVVQVRKKKKHDKKLQITVLDYNPKPLRADAIKASKAKLDAMAAKEHEVQAVNAMKNELEAAIYGARDKLEGETLTQVSTVEQREEVTKLCTEIEDWTYEGSTSKMDYETRLESLRAVLGPIEERALELEARSELPETVKEILDDIQLAKAFIKKNMTWLNESKIEKTQEKLSEFTDWWAQRQEKQKSLPLSEAPAYTKADVVERIGKVQKEWEKLKKLKKPKEQKEVKKKDGKEKDAKKPDLPDTVEATEKALADARKAKQDAVANEDYDKAQALKKDEDALQKHLAQLKEKNEL